MVRNQQGHVAILALAACPGEQLDQGYVPSDEIVDPFGDRIDRGEVDVAFGPRLELRECLRSAQHHDRQDGQLLFVDLQRVRRAVEILQRAAAGLPGETGEIEIVQFPEQSLDVGLVERRDRLPVVLLVARCDEGIDGHRVVVRSRHLLLDERSQNSCLFERQFHAASHSIPEPCAEIHNGCGREPWFAHHTMSVDLDAVFKSG